MNHLDTDWSEPTSIEKWRMPILLGIVFCIMIALAAFFLGGSGIMRLLGLVDDSIETTLNIEVYPSEAFLKVDYQSISHPAQMPVKWERGSRHVIEVEHPAYFSEKVILKIPETSEMHPEIETKSSNSEISVNESEISINFRMVSEYVTREIVSKPSRADIIINGVDTDQKTPMSFEFKTGEKVTIIAQRDGYKDSSVQYTASEENTGQKIQLNLNPIPTPAVPKGRLALKNSFPVTVYDGNRKLINHKKSATVYLAPGKHQLKLINSKYFVNEHKTVSIRDKKTTTVTLEKLGAITVETRPSNATMYIEGEELGKAPGTFELSPGLYNVEFKWDECESSITQWIKVISGQTRKVPLVSGCR